MKKIVIFSVITAVVFLSGCGQDINLTVYNNTGILPGSMTYCGARVEWEKGTEANLFTGSGNTVGSNNSFSMQVKEGYDVTVTGYGWYYAVIDSAGNTELTSYTQASMASLYGGYLETPNWYACLYLDKVLIYKK